MKRHRSAADAPSAAQLPPWCYIFATPTYIVTIRDFLSAPRMHPDCLECTQTELRNAVGLMKFLTCSTELAGRDDAECRCRRCGQSVDVPQVVFKRLEDMNKLFWNRWHHAQHLRELIAREATTRVTILETRAFDGRISPRAARAHYLQWVSELSQCRGNPSESDTSDTPTYGSRYDALERT